MLMLIRLALRSLLRNKRRSAMTIGAVAIGVAVVIIAYGFGDGFIAMMQKNMMQNRLAAIQIHRAGYLDASEASPLKLDIADADAVMQKAQRIPGVVAVTPRLRFGGILSNGKTSSIVMGEALDPVRELAVCPGRSLDVDTTGGAFLSAQAPHGGVVGAELAKSLNIKAGGSLTLSASGREGSVNAFDLDVAGVTRGATSILEAKRVIMVPLPYAQDLLQMQGRITEIAVRVDDLPRIPAVAQALRDALGPAYEVSTWDEVMPFLRDGLERLRIVLRGVSAVLFFIVVFGIINTMLMNVYERVREIGTMLAVGVRRAQVLALFLLEALGIGVIGGGSGAAIGIAVTWALARHGVSLTPPGGVFPQIVHPVARFDLAVLAVVVAGVGALVAAAYPARKASLLDPVEALRTN